MNLQISVARPIYMSCMAILISCSSPVKYYSLNDFENVPKIDAHFHYLTFDGSYMKYAIAQNFRLLTPIWDGEVPIDEQLKVSDSIQNRFPEYYAFFGTFPVDSFGYPDFADRAIAHIKECIHLGAAGIKIWKNIGMVLQDSSGHYVMIDDPAFEPVFQYLESNKIPVIAHLGEPKDCWLPENEMTDPGDVNYYRNNPQYHMYFHPEVPSYEAQIKARDNILEKYPGLDFVGAHLGSLEWSVDELAKRFDTYPSFKVDLAARIFHLQYQSDKDFEKVRNFMIKYQDRIIYGSDSEVHDIKGIDPGTACENLRKGWLNNWIYLATDSSVNGKKGLRLPAEVIDKIYYTNSGQYF